MRRKRATVMTFFVLAGLIGAIVLWLRAQQRQHALNRALIAALVEGDDGQAIRLVTEGADPNTRYEPPPAPSLPDLLKQLFHRLPQAVNKSDTAFSIACGAFWSTGDPNCFLVQMTRKGNPQLLEVMLRHGALVNVKGQSGKTPLNCAATLGRIETVRVLLRHYADVNAQDASGRTALRWAVEDAYLTSPPYLDGVRLLLAYRADPNLADINGRTPLAAATANRAPMVVALLRQAGAKK